ncbi:MAG: cob(I)yrinic acid a,c-diamide adenosyltransferase [Hyphomicrobiales bacterium]|nr:cob(I)yrinic acid a,c-diamide adenosyltransferase [Hyphomicrobiales bacterium]
MVTLNRIYTKTGDTGTTALGTGERVPKTHARIAAYGTVDETNSVIGVARANLSDDASDVDAMLGRIQNDLFDLGADLCMPDDGVDRGYEPLRITQAQVKRLEAEIDAMNAELEALKSFILPGGSEAAATLHVARTVARRAERGMAEVKALDGEPVSEAAMKYINRLSDFLFVAARFVNDRGEADILWTPGENR